MKPTDQPAPQPSPGDILTALTTLATQLDTRPGDPFTNGQRVEAILNLTISLGPGVFDLALVQTAHIDLPMTRGEYAAALRRITGVR